MLKHTNPPLGIFFCTSEAAFQFEKAVYFRDYPRADRLKNAYYLKQVRKIGDQVRGFNADQWATVAKSLKLILLNKSNLISAPKTPAP
jgi:predicted NAD-dependent protein-ADP-ribosyltransferase YbiA (DUF1768 family)